MVDRFCFFDRAASLPSHGKHTPSSFSHTLQGPAGPLGTVAYVEKSGADSVTVACPSGKLASAMCTALKSVAQPSLTDVNGAACTNGASGKPCAALVCSSSGDTVTGIVICA